nr:hypothetical protein [Solanum melongena]WMB97123.1 hypothetical protein [Solanum aethiopicum]
MDFHSQDHLVYVFGASPDCLKIGARYDKGPWEKAMKSQGRASEPTQAKIGTRRLEEQPEKGKAVETADSPVRHSVRLTTVDREVTIPVSISGSECSKCRRWIRCEHRPKASWGSAIAKHCGITVQATYGWRTTYGLFCLPFPICEMWG